MIDLSSAETQRLFKRLQRTSATANVLMCAFTAISIGITVWASSLGPRDSISWAETTFFVLIGLIAAFFIGVFIWEIFMRKSYKRTVYTYVAQGFDTMPQLLQGEEVFLEIMLAGEKLVVMRRGRQEILQYELTPVKSYTSVCAYIVKCLNGFLREYYFNAAGKKSVNSAEVIDNVRGKEKHTRLIENGAPSEKCKSGYCIKTGLIK